MAIQIVLLGKFYVQPRIHNEKLNLNILKNAIKLNNFEKKITL